MTAQGEIEFWNPFEDFSFPEAMLNFDMISETKFLGFLDGSFPPIASCSVTHDQSLIAIQSVDLSIRIFDLKSGSMTIEIGYVCKQVQIFSDILKIK